MTSKQYFTAEELNEFLDGIFNPNFDSFKEFGTVAANCGLKVDTNQAVSTKNPAPSFEIQSVLSNHKKNAFTVVWTDGTHTTVHCQPGDEWDDEKALAMCFTKKALGNKGNFNDKFNDALDNKMKTIRAEKEVEKPCAGLNVKSCKGCHENECKKDLVVNTDTATVSLSDKISSLENLPKYNLFIRYGGDDLHAGHFYGKKVTKEKARELAHDKFGRAPYYYRTWMEGNCLVIDFGSHSTFIVIEGMTPQEWIED